MSYQERAELYKKIEAERGRPLIAYVTSIRPNAGGQIAQDVLSELIRQVNQIPSEQREVDVLLVSNGGDPIAAARIVSLLRARFDKVAVLLPYVAYSAATLIAMGADEIIMHPYSNLGPVDTQIEVVMTGPDGTSGRTTFGTEDLRNYFSFVRSDVGISDQEYMSRAFELLCKQISPTHIGAAKRGAQLSPALGEHLLNLHMDDAAQAKAITDTLIRSYHHHGYALGKKEAAKIGLPIKHDDSDKQSRLESYIWGVWEDIEEEMECNKPFEPSQVVLGNANTAPLLDAIPQVQMPSNLPPQLVEQVYNGIMQQISIINVPPTDYEWFLATLESVRGHSEHRVRGKIFATRLPDMRIAISITQTYQGWQTL